MGMTEARDCWVMAWSLASMWPSHRFAFSLLGLWIQNGQRFSWKLVSYWDWHWMMHIYIYTIYVHIYIYITVSVTISKHIHEATWSVAGFRDFLISLPYMMECWNTSLVRFQHEKRLPGPRLSSCESHGFFFTKRCWRWMQDMLETGMPPSCKKRYFEPNVIAQLI